jgi:hypothetical protein
MDGDEQDEAFVAYNKVDGYVPTLVGNWVEVSDIRFPSYVRANCMTNAGLRSVSSPWVDQGLLIHEVDSTQ